MKLPDVTTLTPIVEQLLCVSAFTTTPVSSPDVVIVSPTSNSLCVAVYFKSGASKEIIVPVAPDMFDVNVSSADIVPDTVLRTAYLGNANVGADVKSIPCSIILNDVALPISEPNITVPPVAFKVASDDSFIILPPDSNSTLPALQIH